MLKSLRDNVRNLHWILWIVIAAFIALVFVDFRNVNPNDLQGAAASVGGSKITFAEYQRAYQNMEQQYSQMFGAQWNTQLADQLKLNQRALEQLVNQRVLELEAPRLGVTVSDEELRKTILKMPTFQGADGKFVGAERYPTVVANMGFKVEDFEDLLRREMLLQKVFQVLSQNVYVSDAELEASYRERAEQASIRYLLLPAALFAAEAQATPEELSTYLAAHAEEYRLPEQRKVAYLLVDRNLLRGQVEIPDSEIEAYYQDHASEYDAPEQVRARHILLRNKQGVSEADLSERIRAIRKRIEGGEDFAQVAREVSEDPGSAPNGGDLDFFGRGQMVPAFDEAAFGAQVGELVGPVTTDFGVHLLQVTERRDAGRRPLAEVRDQIRLQLAQDRVGDVARDRAAKIAETLATAGGGPSVEAMRAAAEADQAVFVYEPPPFGTLDAVAGLGRAPAFNEAAFELTAGQLSPPIEVPRGYAVIYAQEVLPSREAAVADVEPRLRQAVESEKRQRLALARLEEAKSRLGGGESLDALAASLGVEVQEAGPFGAAGPVGSLGSAPQVSRAAVGLDEGAIGGPYETAQGAVLFQVSTRQRFDPAEFAGNREQLREQETQQRANSMIGSLVQQRRAELGVQYSQQVINDLGLDGTSGNASEEG